jgi:regulator of sigma E protease
MGWDLTNIVLAILGIGLLVAFHELGHHLVALWTGMRVRRFSIGFGPSIVSREHKGVTYTIGALPLGGYVDIAGMNPLEEDAHTDPRSYQRRPKWARALVVAAGPVFNYALAWVLMLGLFSLGGLKQDVEFVVQEVMPESAALEAGFLQGDVVMKVGGETLSRNTPLQSKVGVSAGQPLDLLVRRDGQVMTITATPRGAPGEGRLGIKFEIQPVGPGQNYSVVESLALASTMLVVGTTRILEDVARMIRPGEKVEVGGPVAIVNQLKQSATHSVADFLWMLATLSVMLGLFNLFPIPPLDGSKLVIMAAEVVVRRDVPAKLQLYVHGVGMLVMLSLLLLVTVGDVRRLVSPDKTPDQTPATAPAGPADAGMQADPP